MKVHAIPLSLAAITIFSVVVGCGQKSGEPFIDHGSAPPGSSFANVTGLKVENSPANASFQATILKVEAIVEDATADGADDLRDLYKSRLAGKSAFSALNSDANPTTSSVSGTQTDSPDTSTATATSDDSTNSNIAPPAGASVAAQTRALHIVNIRLTFLVDKTAQTVEYVSKGMGLAANISSKLPMHQVGVCSATAVSDVQVQADCDDQNCSNVYIVVSKIGSGTASQPSAQAPFTLARASSTSTQLPGSDTISEIQFTPTVQSQGDLGSSPICKAPVQDTTSDPTTPAANTTSTKKKKHHHSSATASGTSTTTGNASGT